MVKAARCAALVAELRKTIADDVNGECMPLSEGVTLDDAGQPCAVFLVPLPREMHKRPEVRMLANMEQAVS